MRTSSKHVIIIANRVLLIQHSSHSDCNLGNGIFTFSICFHHHGQILMEEYITNNDLQENIAP